MHALNEAERMGMKLSPEPTAQSPRRVRRGGLSLVELMIALAIISTLLTATAVALDISFKAYAIATQSASTQSSTRLLTNRLLTNIRTAAGHGPLTSGEPGVTLLTDTLIESPFIEFVDRNGDGVRLNYDDAADVLQLIRTPASTGIALPAVPILEGVTACKFLLQRGKDRDGIYVLERATFDFTVEAGDDSTMAIEAGNVPPVRVIASTKPRRI